MLGFAIYFLIETIKTIKNATGTDFRQADLTGANFSDATPQNTEFSTAIIAFVNWTGVNFTRCQFPDYFNDSRIIQLCTHRDGRGQNYHHADLKNLHLQGVILSDADLTGADLSGADLRYANLERSNLSEVQALGSSFTEAILTGACIQHWGINSSTQFTDVQCHYIYLKSPQVERKPASGLFKPGDFEKLVNQFTNTLDFLFRNGIEPQAFDLALHNLLTEYEQAGLSLHSVVALGDGDRLVRLDVTDPNADKGAMHQQFMQDYESVQKQLQAEREQNVDLQKQLEHTKGQLTVYREQSTFLQQFVYHQTNQFSRPTLNTSQAHFKGGFMSNDSSNIQFGNVQGDVSGVAGGDNTGVAGKGITGAAGGDISGTLTITMGQLEDSKDPEALKLADLLKQLKTAIEKPDSGLTPKDRDKALKHIDSIGKLGTEPNNADLLDKAGDALDALPTIIKRGNGLIEFAEKYLPTITTGIKAILGGWGISL
ncbi:pentapeptide repeat-containing protein [Pantanalinema sp. GBBB05]|uniref:pentapeptide repeat-containing protein n=1 Tax=Pantanalinema sp. GBBB05 TaxID=2604139 RepID=UPI003D81AEAB